MSIQACDRHRQLPPWPLVLGGRAVLLASSLLALASPTAASACSYGTHCWAEADWEASGLGTVYDGIQVSLFANSLTAGTGDSRDHSQIEIWACSASVNNCSYTDWVEEGWHIGYRVGEDTGTALAWFWADKTASNCSIGYDEHYGFAPVSLGQTHIAKIVMGASGFSAFVYKDGTKIGTSRPCHADTLGSAATGAEIMANNAAVLGSSLSFTKRNHANNVWTSTWPSSWLVETSDPPLSAGWSQPYLSADFWSH